MSHPCWRVWPPSDSLHLISVDWHLFFTSWDDTITLQFVCAIYQIRFFYTNPLTKAHPETIFQTIYETKVPCIILLVKSEMAVFQLLGSNLSSLSSLTENRWIFLNREWPQRSEPNIKKIWDDFRWLYKSTHVFFSAPRKKIWNPQNHGGWVQMTCHWLVPFFQIFGVPQFLRWSSCEISKFLRRFFGCRIFTLSTN